MEYSRVPASDTGLTDPLSHANAVDDQAQLDGSGSARGSESARLAIAKPLLEPSSLRGRWLAGEFTIVPDKSRGLDVWDSLVITALISTALVLPFEVAFFSETPRPLWVFNRLVDVIFAIDILVTFQVAYTDHKALTSDWYERDPIKIARHYTAMPLSDGGVAGWFWLDFLTVFPWDICGVESVRLVRILRLLRMMRLVRVVKLCNRWHSRVGASYAFLNILKCAVCTLMVLHWLTCIWGFIGMSARLTDSGSWLELYAESTDQGLHDLSVYEVYNLSMYFCVMTLTGVGFGDISPGGQFEIMLCTITMFLTGFVWAWVIANVVNVVRNLDSFTSYFQSLNDDLNTLMESRGLSLALKMRARKHLHEAFKVHRQRHQQSTIQALSAGLQGEIALESGADEVCNCVWYLRNLDPDVLVELANYFLPYMYSPCEQILHRQAVSVIRRGCCYLRGVVLLRDAVIGEDMLLSSERLQDTVLPKALNIVEVMTLQREDLQLVCDRFPELSRRIRMAQVRLIVRRGVFFYARQVRALRCKSANLTHEELQAEALRAGNFMKRPRFFATNDRHAQLCNVVNDLKLVVQDHVEQTRDCLTSLAEQISRLGQSAVVADLAAANISLPDSSRQMEKVAGTSSVLQDSVVSAKLSEMEATQALLAERVSTVAAQQARVLELSTQCSQLLQAQASVCETEHKLAPAQPMRDLTTPTVLHESAAKASPSISDNVGEQDPTSSVDSTILGGGMAQPGWAKGLLARLHAIDQKLNDHHGALQASLEEQRRHSEEIERRIAECLSSRWAEAPSMGVVAMPALDQMTQLSGSIVDELAAKLAQQQIWLEAQAETSQGKLAEISRRISDDLGALKAISNGEAVCQTQLQAQLEADQRLVEAVRQIGISLETAVSAQLTEFGTSLHQRIGAQQEILGDASIDLVKRQSEALKARLTKQLGRLDFDCFQRAQHMCDKSLQKQGERRRPVSHGPSYSRCQLSPQNCLISPRLPRG